jgi:hypothetical protein
MKTAFGQRVGQVVAVAVLGSMLLLLLVAAGTATLARQRRAVPGARPATASVAVRSQEATSAAPSTGVRSGQAALLAPVRPVRAQEQTLILVASPEQAKGVTEQLDQVRRITAPFGVPPSQPVVLVVSPTENAALAASLQQRVLVAGYPLGPVIDLRTSQ